MSFYSRRFLAQHSPGQYCNLLPNWGYRNCRYSKKAAGATLQICDAHFQELTDMWFAGPHATSQSSRSSRNLPWSCSWQPTSWTRENARPGCLEAEWNIVCGATGLGWHHSMECVKTAQPCKQGSLWRWGHHWVWCQHVAAESRNLLTTMYGVVEVCHHSQGLHLNLLVSKG